MMNKSALIVDDSRLARLTLAKLLAKKDYSVLEAESVNLAYELLTTMDQDSLPEMIFMDINMPEVDGIEGVKIIKTNPAFRHIPCAMYSSEPSVEIQKKASTVGAAGYLYKPANEEDLDEVLKILLSAGTEGSAAANEAAAAVVNDAAIAEKLASTQHANKVMRENIQVIDRRTKNLARILMQERKENAALIKSLEGRVDQAFTDNCEDKQQDPNLELKRLENDIMGQIKGQQNKLNTFKFFAFGGIGLGVVALIVALIS